MTSVALLAQQTGVRALLALPRPVKRLLAGKELVVDGDALGAETQMVLRMQHLLREHSPGHYPVHKARRVMDHQAATVAGRLPIGAVEDVDLGGLSARRYVPKALLDSPARPTLVFIHGGGFFLGGLDSHDAPCRFLAERAGVQVISVDYRLAPEAVAPAALVDCVAAHEWVATHATELAVDTSRIAIGGDSAGGNLAIGVARAAAASGTPLAFQLLIYPMTQIDSRTESKELFGTGFYLDVPFMNAATEHYAPTPELREDPRVSPLLGDVPAGLAPAYLCTAGFDPLRDEGEAYAAKVAAAGATVEVRRFGAEIHGFLNIVGVGSESRACVAEIADALRKGLGP
jgi:acetyl esterase